MSLGFFVPHFSYNRMTSASLRADYMVQQRRNRETFLDGMNQHLAADYKLRQKATWEQKTAEVVAVNNVKQKVAEIKAERARELDQRRARLAELLMSEEEQYRQEYIARQETPEDIRRRMAERLQTLREARLKEREADVKRRLDQRWKESADELRLQDGQLSAQHTRLEQERQMWEKQQKSKQEQEESMLFDELWRREYIRRGEAEAEDLRKKEELNQSRLTQLNWQRDMRADQRAAEQNLSEAEKAMLRQEWEKERLRESELQEERRRMILQTNRDILTQNESIIQQKQLEIERERETDKRLIEAALAREQQAFELEKQQRLQQRLEAKATQQFVSDKSRKEAEFDKMIERAAKEENDRQWERAEAKWQAQEGARIALLRDVYEARAREIDAKRVRELEEKKREIAEKERIESEVRKAEEVDEMRKQALRMTKVSHQEDVKWQITDKERQKQQEVQDEMYEVRAMKLAELEYKRKIEEERKKGKALLDELRAKRPF